MSRVTGKIVQVLTAPSGILLSLHVLGATATNRKLWSRHPTVLEVLAGNKHPAPQNPDVGPSQANPPEGMLAPV